MQHLGNLLGPLSTPVFLAVPHKPLPQLGDLLLQSFATLHPLGLDLLQKTLIFKPSKRISAKVALRHPYFDDLDKSGLDV